MKIDYILVVQTEETEHYRKLLRRILLWFSHSVVSASLRPHGLQHTRLPCPSLSPRGCLNSSTESVMPSNHLILCCPLLLLPSIFASIRVFSNELALCIRPKYWSFSFSISPSNEYSELISFRIDWFDLLAVQGTLKSLLQHHSSKEASILWPSAFFIVQLQHSTKCIYSYDRSASWQGLADLGGDFLSFLLLSLLIRHEILGLQA